MSKLEMFSEAYEAKKNRENVDSINKEVKGYVELQNIIDAINVLDYAGDEKKQMIAAEVKEDFHVMLKGGILRYVKEADTHEHYARTKGSEIDEDSKAKLESLSLDRRSAHNSLIFDINLVGRELRMLGIDNNLFHDIIGEDRDLTEGESDRRAVERWARHIADYFAAVSETTN